MKKLYFCARALQDYLSHIKNVDMLNLPAAESFAPELLDLPFVQKFLSSLSRAEDDNEISGATNIAGLRLDFNCGLRLELPEGNFRVVISDFDSGQIFFDRNISDVRLVSVEKYFIRWRVEIFLDGAKILNHILDLEKQNVHIAFDKGSGLGDILAFLPFAQEFKRIFKSHVVISLPDYLSELAANFYPELEQDAAINFYATYYPLINFGDFPTVTADVRSAPLNRMAGEILGLKIIPPKPTFKPTLPKLFKEPYVCIGVQASTPTKGWLYPDGWKIIVDYLKSLGYRVFCVDKNAEETNNDITIKMPEGAENFTIGIPLPECANIFSHAEFCIAVSSGLVSLADAVNCPVVMIAGFSQDWCEFYTPYRVANRKVCNGCFNDMRRVPLSKCMFHKDTPRELECQKKISPRMVINAIERLIADKQLIPPARSIKKANLINFSTERRHQSC